MRSYCVSEDLIIFDGRGRRRNHVGRVGWTRTCVQAFVGCAGSSKLHVVQVRYPSHCEQKVRRESCAVCTTRCPLHFRILCTEHARDHSATLHTNSADSTGEQMSFHEFHRLFPFESLQIRSDPNRSRRASRSWNQPHRLFRSIDNKKCDGELFGLRLG